jgi:hypothetical protein
VQNQCSATCPPAQICVLAGSPTPACAHLCPAPPCVGLDETACQAEVGCVADYCQQCSCTPTYVGCRDATDTPPPCPQVDCATQPACTCGDLDETSCGGAQGTELGCTAVYCDGCNGTRTYAGCAGPGQTIACTTGACPQTCRADSDCVNALCVPAGASAGCGPCRSGDPACTTDSDCASQGPTSICAVPVCACQPTVTACIPGCTADSDCGLGETCGDDHRCAPSPCTLPSDCPDNFMCDGGQCGRQTCAVDSDCALGPYCVEGGCYPALGQCTLPPP